MTSPLWQYVMQGQLAAPPFQTVYWLVYNAPDSTGLQSGYFGQLQNISIASQQQITFPNNATPTLDANSLTGIPIVNTPPTNGQALVYNSISNTYVPAPVGNNTPGAASTVFTTNVTATATQFQDIKVTNTTKTINVCAAPYGAKGDGVTDDTAAIQAAAAAFQAAMLANGFPTYGGSGFSLYFPAGNYLISAPITISGITGGVIHGDGITSSVLICTGSAAMAGAFGLLVLKNCQHTTVHDLEVFAQSTPMALTGAGLTGGGTSFTVSFVANVAARQLCALVSADGTKAEMVSIVSAVGTTITISRGSLYTYAAGALLVNGPLGCVTCLNDDRIVLGSHANKFERVAFGGTSSHGSLFGFATMCRGGAPVATVGSAAASQPVITVTDATQVVVGETYTMWNGIAATLDTRIVQSTDIVAKTVTFTVNLSQITPASSYLVSASDANNDEHVFHHCTANNATIAGFGLNGWNSLNHVVTDTEVGGSYCVVSARQGGSIKFIGGDASGYGVCYEFGGGQQQPQILDKTESEGSSGAQLLVAHSVDNTQGITVWANHVVAKNHPITTGNMIDITSTSISVTLNACSLAPGLAGGNAIALNFVDSSGSGLVVLHGNCQIGPDAVILSGVALIDVDSTWSSPATFGQAPAETLSNGGVVRTIAPSYGARNGAGGGSIERLPTQAIALANGNNDSVALTGGGDIVVTGPTGNYVLKGFATKNIGQRVRIKFNVNQQLTIKNNSSAGVPILTPTGADIVIAAAGAFVIRDFWCDGTNWNLVQGGTGP